MPTRPSWTGSARCRRPASTRPPRRPWWHGPRTNCTGRWASPPSTTCIATPASCGHCETPMSRNSPTAAGSGRGCEKKAKLSCGTASRLNRTRYRRNFRRQIVTDTVMVDTADRIMVITINRPEVKNAVDSSVATGIAAAIDDLEARDDLTAAILTGAGGTFCAGMDLKAFLRGESPSIPGRGFAGLTESPPTKPLIAAAEGWALAGGCELVLTADIVVASTEAKFGLPEVKRGLVAAAGGLRRLPKALPYSLAMLTALTGEPITAEHAERHGLVAILAEPGQALAVARDVAAKIAANGPLAVKATKQILSQQSNWTDLAAFDWQREITGRGRESGDA